MSRIHYEYLDTSEVSTENREYPSKKYWIFGYKFVSFIELPAQQIYQFKGKKKKLIIFGANLSVTSEDHFKMQ